MQRYEYRVVPAPNRSEKIRGIKAPDDRFAHTLSGLMNDLGREGWEYLRADTLPTEERKGLTGRVTVYHNLLVFRRPSPEAMQAELVRASVESAPRHDVLPVRGPASRPAESSPQIQAPQPEPAQSEPAQPEPVRSEPARQESKDVSIGNVARKMSSRPEEGAAPPIASGTEGAAPRVGPAPGKDLAAE